MMLNEKQIKEYDELRSQYKQLRRGNYTRDYLFELLDKFYIILKNKFGKDVIDMNNVSYIIEELGGNINIIDVDKFGYSDLTRSIFIHSRNNFDILLPNNSDIMMDFCLIAKMLAHYYLHGMHSGYEKLYLDMLNEDRVLHREGDIFALCLIMPTKVLLEKIDWDIKDLSKFFTIPEDIVKIRLNILNYKGDFKW